MFTLVCLPAVGQVTPATSNPSPTPSTVVAEVDGRELGVALDARGNVKADDDYMTTW